MKCNKVEVDEHGGVTVVKGWDQAGTLHRYWVDQTDAGRTAVCAEVIVVEETGPRDYVDVNNLQVPDRVREALTDAGYEADTLYDVNGRVIE